MFDQQTQNKDLLTYLTDRPLPNISTGMPPRIAQIYYLAWDIVRLDPETLLDVFWIVRCINFYIDATTLEFTCKVSPDDDDDSDHTDHNPCGDMEMVYCKEGPPHDMTFPILMIAMAFLAKGTHSPTGAFAQLQISSFSLAPPNR
jgi:hypothetical protein